MFTYENAENTGTKGNEGTGSPTTDRQHLRSRLRGCTPRTRAVGSLFRPPPPAGLRTLVPSHRRPRSPGKLQPPRGFRHQRRLLPQHAARSPGPTRRPLTPGHGSEKEKGVEEAARAEKRFVVNGEHGDPTSRWHPRASPGSWIEKWVKSDPLGQEGDVQTDLDPGTQHRVDAELRTHVGPPLVPQDVPVGRGRRRTHTGETMASVVVAHAHACTRAHTRTQASVEGGKDCGKAVRTAHSFEGHTVSTAR